MQRFRTTPGHPALLRLFAGLLVLLCGLVGTTGYALSETEGLLPSLDSEPAAEAPAITPITDLIGQPEQFEPATQPKTQAESQPQKQSQKQSQAQPEARLSAISAAPAEVSLKKSAGNQAESQAKSTVSTQSPAKSTKKAAAQTVKKNRDFELKPLLDQSQASHLSQESAKGLTAANLATDSASLQPLHAEQALTPLVPDDAGKALSPLKPTTESGPALTPLQPAAVSPDLSNENQPTLDLEPARTSTGSTSSQEAPTLKGPAEQPAERKPLAAKASHKAKPQKSKPEPTLALETKTTETKTTEPKPTESKLEKPVAPAANPFKFSKDVGQAIQNVKSSFLNEKTIQPVSYTPLPGIAVFAVVKHGNERAFGDLPVLFAREYAQQLGAKLPETKIYNPIYTVDELRMQGMGHVYDQIMNYYVKTGAPEPAATAYLLKHISNNRPNISRVIFVEADVDFTHPDASTSLFDRTKQLMTDGTPKQMKYFVVSHLQVFDAEKPGFPIVWAGNWQRSIKTDQFYNVTPSVYADSDSQQSFARVSRQMSQEMIYVTPKGAYMTPNFDTSVEGKLVSGKQPATASPSGSQDATKGLSHENQQVIERILQRQNETSP